jgi:ppGpp synthetase/RelA/SpoT-type nucleotidyltranferase
MKVPPSIRRLYDEQREGNARLKEFVDERLKRLKRDRWHYESRLKGLESFALKVESGRFATPGALEDFFACTLIVANGKEIQDAEQLIRDHFTVHARRPRRDRATHKEPNAFPFDDLRLYVRLQDDPALPPRDFAGILFEIQVKTFLQHAWGIATHDLIYKTDESNWSKERIAFQIKAMLEHVEVSIQEAELLAQSQALAKTNHTTRTLQRIIDLLRAFIIDLLRALWSEQDLPTDVRRLAENIQALAEAVKIDVTRLRAILERQQQQGKGPLTRNLSPYGIVVQSLLSECPEQFMALLSAADARRKVVIPAEIEWPAELDRRQGGNALFIGEPRL